MMPKHPADRSALPGRLDEMLTIIDPDHSTSHLVLSRLRDESIIVTDEETGRVLVILTVVDIRGAKVRLGCHANKGTRIDREEISLTRMAESTLTSLERKEKAEAWLAKHSSR